jgi:small subunit ribosomal protein S7
MGRRHRASPREIQADPRYNTDVVTKFVNDLMWDGKKTTALRIFYDAMDIIERKTKEDGFALFERAFNNVKPVLEVRPRRVGGSTYQVPVEVRPKRRLSLAIKWIVRAARARSEYRMADKLANELLDAAQNQGAAYKKKEETHKMAEANRAFAHFRW